MLIVTHLVRKIVGLELLLPGFLVENISGGLVVEDFTFYLSTDKDSEI